jgi:hypothetical protein
MKGVAAHLRGYGTDKLSGAETLEYLNTAYARFDMDLLPGLTYMTTVYDGEPTSKSWSLGGRSRYGLALFDETGLAEKTQRLLYRTNHAALLQACRAALGDFNAGRFSRNVIRVPRDINDEKLSADVKRLPPALLQLEPAYLCFEKDRVVVSLIGIFGHLGVEAFADNREPAPKDNRFPLIDGLWYYDDGLREGGPQYREYLKSLEKEVTTPFEYRRKHGPATEKDGWR